MPLSFPSQPIIVCCDSVNDQATLSSKLAPYYDHILACQLNQFDALLQKESVASVVVSWRQPSAELRMMVEACQAYQSPLVVLLKQFQASDIKRLPETYDFVLLPFDTQFELKPWLEYAQQVRDKDSRVKKEVAQLAQQLQERKWVEKAKGLLMRLHGLEEEKAYQLLRKSAMQSSLPLAQVAKNVVQTLERN